MEKEPELEHEDAAEAEAEAPRAARAAENAREERSHDTPADRERPRRRGRGRRRPCVMCVEKMKYIDFKNFGFLRRYLSDRGRIESRRKTGACAKHQRALAQAIKRARHLALLPYTADHVRTLGGSATR